MMEFKLPSLGADMDDGTLLKWLVKPGDSVHRGQVVAVVDTAKAAVDMEIWSDGVIAELLVEPGIKVPVGTPLATLLEPGETPALPNQPQPAAPATAAAPLPEAAVASLPRPPVSPAARRRAKELGIDVQSLPGSGAHGAVTLADIEAAAQAIQAAAAMALVRTPVVPLARQTDMRRAIGTAMARSKREIPHYYLSQTICMAPTLDWLQEHNAHQPITERILPAVLQLKAVALALRRVPQLNGFFLDGAFQPATAVHAGVAITLRSGGLVAPALHDVADKSPGQLMRELTELVKRARAGSLRSSEMSNPTITVSNLGDQGADTVFGVIYPPQVALVGFGTVALRPWVEGELLCVRPLVQATLAADHRVTDGHLGTLFLAELASLLQHPQALTTPVATHPDEGTP